ncbi:MAG: PaaI family thioesterase [Polyangiales bacterium]
MSERVKAPKTQKHLAWCEQLARGEVQGPPISRTIGFTCTHAALGTATMEMDTEPERHANPMGTLHGGVLCDLADAALGTAMSSTLEDDETFTSVDLTIKFFKPIWRSHLRATATVTKRSRSLGMVECDVLDDGGSLVAKLFSTCMVLRGKDAEGRQVGEPNQR